MIHQLRLGALFLLGGEALLAIMGAMIKHLSDELSTEQIVFFRNAFGLLVLLPLILRHGVRSLTTTVLHWHVFRSLVGVTAMYCYFWALGNMPLTEAFLVNLSSPLFMPFIAWWWLSEPAGRNSILALFIGFLGVIFILQPSGDNAMTWPALIGLLGAVLAALARVTIRRMSETEPSSRIVFYFALIATVISAIPALLSWQPVPTELWGWLVLLGLIATLGQLAITKAYRIAEAGKVGVYAYSAVLYGALMGWYFWQEIPLWTTWLGAALIISAGILNLRGSQREARQEPSHR